MDLLVAKFSTILDRLRIPLLAKEGLALAASNTGLVIERVGDIPTMTTWVKKQIEALRAKKPTNV